MTWMNLRPAGAPCNAFYVMNLGIGILIVPPSSLQGALGMDEAVGEEEEEEGGQEEEEEFKIYVIALHLSLH